MYTRQCAPSAHEWLSSPLCGAGQGKRVCCEAVAVPHCPMWHQEGRQTFCDSQGSQPPIVSQNQQNNGLSMEKLKSCNSSHWTHTNLLVFVLFCFVFKKQNLIAQIIIGLIIMTTKFQVFVVFLKVSLKNEEMSSGKLPLQSVAVLRLCFFF